MKKIPALFLCGALALGCLSGCNSQEPAQTGTQQADAQSETAETGVGQSGQSAASSEEPYEVHMRFALPSVTVNNDEVDRIVEKINEITLEELNMTLDLVITPQASYDEQIQLELSSGSEDVDLFMTHYAYGPTWVNEGYVTDLTELLQEYGQDILSSYSSPELATVC